MFSVLCSMFYLVLHIRNMGFPDGSAVKNLPSVQETWVVFGSGRSPGERNGNPLQYSCLENPMGRRAGWATVCKASCRTEMTEHACIRNTDMKY